jgi:steroid 5-alpha reductase family enzyme
MSIEAVYLLFAAFGYAFLWMSFLWVLHLVLKNAAIIDVGWPICLFIYAAVYITQTPYVNVPETILLFVVGLWAIRLSTYLFIDRIYKKPEEGRYTHLREIWKTNIALKFFFFYHAQTLLNVFLSLPFLVIALDPTPNEWLLFAGALVAILGITGETIADLQLKFFKLNPANKGKICRIGLWDYSRHPNYFFEFVYWCGLGLMGQSADYGFIGWIAPALILGTLFKVTGIPATEKQALKSRGDAYKQYMSEVNQFIPLRRFRNKN